VAELVDAKQPYCSMTICTLNNKRVQRRGAEAVQVRVLPPQQNQNSLRN